MNAAGRPPSDLPRPRAQRLLRPEPSPALSSMLGQLAMLDDARATALRARTLATPREDSAAWRALYDDALAEAQEALRTLELKLVGAQQRRTELMAAGPASGNPFGRVAEQCASDARQGLKESLADHNDRLRRQVQYLWETIEPAIRDFELERNVEEDEEMFRPAAAFQAQFETHVQSVLDQWAKETAASVEKRTRTELATWLRGTAGFEPLAPPPGIVRKAFTLDLPAWETVEQREVVTRFWSGLFRAARGNLMVVGGVASMVATIGGFFLPRGVREATIAVLAPVALGFAWAGYRREHRIQSRRLKERIGGALRGRLERATRDRLERARGLLERQVQQQLREIERALLAWVEAHVRPEAERSRTAAAGAAAQLARERDAIGAEISRAQGDIQRWRGQIVPSLLQRQAELAAEAN